MGSGVRDSGEATEAETGSASWRATNALVTPFSKNSFLGAFLLSNPFVTMSMVTSSHCPALLSPFSPLLPILSSPVHRNGRHRVDAGEHRRDRKEVLEATVVGAEVPLAVKRIDEVDQGVEGSHGGVGESQVHEEVVGDGPHALVGQDDPDDDEIPEDRHGHHHAVRQGPEGDAPGRLHELVGEVGRGLRRRRGGRGRCRRGGGGREVAGLDQQVQPLGLSRSRRRPCAESRAQVPGVRALRPVRGCGQRAHRGACAARDVPAPRRQPEPTPQSSPLAGPFGRREAR